MILFVQYLLLKNSYAKYLASEIATGSSLTVLQGKSRQAKAVRGKDAYQKISYPKF